MSMQIVKTIIVMILISSPVAATECQSKLIGLRVYFYSRGEQWSKTWKANGVHKEEADYYANLKEDSRTNMHDSRGNERSKRLPQTLLANKMAQQQAAGNCEPNPGKEFNIPFDISQNGELLIAAIYEKSQISHPSQQFAIVDLKKQKIVRINDSEYRIEALAWAPDGKNFVVLYSQDVTDHVFKGPIDWLASLAGHPIGYWTFYLTLYQHDGTEVYTEQVEKKLPNAMSYLDWSKQ